MDTEEKMKAAVFCNDTDWVSFDRVFAHGRREKLAEITDLYPERVTIGNFEQHVENLRDIEIIFSTWDMPRLSDAQVKMLPKLKVVFYAAGATTHFREPFEKNGIIVCSATAANAIPVAEFALAQILLAGAGYWRNSRECRDSYSANQVNSHRGHGNFEARIALLGNGAISHKLREYLAPHNLDVVCVPSRAENRTVSLEEAFATSVAVVNLFPDRDDNVGVFNEPLFRSMMDSAVFINVGRGRQVNETDLIKVMKNRPDLTALLDVQYPEPPVDGSELYTLPNIRLSAHLAGAQEAEWIRLADYMIEEFLRFEKDEPLLHQVQPGQL